MRGPANRTTMGVTFRLTQMLVFSEGGLAVQDATQAGDKLLAGRKEWIGLAVLALPTLLVSIDIYVMLLALPQLSADLGANSTQQLWITDVYGFPLAGFLVTMGTLGDRIGRRRLLLIGAAAFAAASIIAAYSTSPGMLIGARALLGLAGAAIAPSTMSLIRTMFKDPKQMGMAIGVWGMCFSMGAIIGPLVGGVMLEHFWWGSVFLLGVPAMLVLLVLGPIYLPEYRAPQSGRLDLVSVAVFLAAILPAVWGLKALAREGWGVLPIVAIIVGVAVGVLFVRRQQSLDDPLLDVSLFRDRAFSAALGSMMFGTMLMGAMMLFVTQGLQVGHGLSTVGTGLWLLPAVLANTVSFMVSPMLARTYRPGYVIGGGLAISVIGLLVLTQVDVFAGPVTLATGFALIYLGAGPLVTLGIGLIMGSAPEEKAGSAAAMNETAGQLGFATGIAVLGSIAVVVYRGKVEIPDNVPGWAAEAAKDSVTGAWTAAANLPAPVADAVLNPARAAFGTELHTVAGISAALLAVVAVMAARLLRHVPPTGTEETADDAADDAKEKAETVA
jgi:MFS transporter, DHA2 family, multidrug resistance protein